MMHIVRLRSERLRVGVEARKRIKIGAPRNGLARLPAAQNAHNAVAVTTGLHFEPNVT